MGICGQCVERTARQNGSLSQKATTSKPTACAARSMPPMPENSDRQRIARLLSPRYRPGIGRQVGFLACQQSHQPRPLNAIAAALAPMRQMDDGPGGDEAAADVAAD